MNASSLSGAGIGSGYGYAPGDPAITAKIEIHGGMITAILDREPASEVVKTVHRRC